MEVVALIQLKCIASVTQPYDQKAIKGKNVFKQQSTKIKFLCKSCFPFLLLLVKYFHMCQPIICGMSFISDNYSRILICITKQDFLSDIVITEQVLSSGLVIEILFSLSWLANNAFSQRGYICQLCFFQFYRIPEIKSKQFLILFNSINKKEIIFYQKKLINSITILLISLLSWGTCWARVYTTIYQETITSPKTYSFHEGKQDKKNHNNDSVPALRQL